MAEDAPPQDVQSFTSADRIRQLNEVDKDVTRLLHSAGLAIQALTNAKPGSSSSGTPDGSLDSHKTRFKEASAQYFALLSSVDVYLRRQVYSLDESSLLEPEKGSRAGDTKAGARSEAATSKLRASNSLDISRLNSRKDTVGKDKEAELWAAARGFVEQMQKPSEASKDSKPSEPEDMQVD
ncbi:hypothetical protein N7475_003843 [Penicillium sp. IBT 31633x]|nr:hypothetical protein N7475_003843 [Penicillium sp. IBT 31633x]